MRLLKSSILTFLIAVMCLAQTGTPLQNPQVRHVGEKLRCLCGGCNATVTTCDMPRCHYSDPSRRKIAAMLSEGKSEDDIITAFVKENGLVANLIPPSEGFYGLGWMMPFIALAGGSLLLYFALTRMRQRPAIAGRPVAAGSAPDDSMLDKHRARIEKELDELD